MPFSLKKTQAVGRALFLELFGHFPTCIYAQDAAHSAKDKAAQNFPADFFSKGPPDVPTQGGADKNRKLSHGRNPGLFRRGGRQVTRLKRVKRCPGHPGRMMLGCSEARRVAYTV